MGKVNDHNCQCEGVQCEGKQGEGSPELERVESFLGSYGYLVSKALVDLASAVETVINNRDGAVLAQMEEVSREIFQQAQGAMNSDAVKVQ